MRYPWRGLVKAVDRAGYTIPVERAALNIGGMTCAACVGHVEEALSVVRGSPVRQREPGY